MYYLMEHIDTGAYLAVHAKTEPAALEQIVKFYDYWMPGKWSAEIIQKEWRSAAQAVHPHLLCNHITGYIRERMVSQFILNSRDVLRLG